MASLTKKQQEVADCATPLAKTSPWVLRVTDWKDVSSPVLVVSERSSENDDGKAKLYEYGHISFANYRVCRNVLSCLLQQVQDEDGRVLGLQQLFDEKVAFRGNLPLDKTVGTKLALFCKLHPMVRGDDRIELLAWRIERFSYEEAAYWLGKCSLQTYGKRSVEWAKTGLRLMLAGKAEDTDDIQLLLEQLRK